MKRPHQITSGGLLFIPKKARDDANEVSPGLE
jgi:hypothetical protein